MLIDGTVIIDRTPTRGVRQHQGEIIPQRLSNAYEGLFFIDFVRHINATNIHYKGHRGEKADQQILDLLTEMNNEMKSVKSYCRQGK